MPRSGASDGNLSIFMNHNPTHFEVDWMRLFSSGPPAPVSVSIYASPEEEGLHIEIILDRDLISGPPQSSLLGIGPIDPLVF